MYTLCKEVIRSAGHSSVASGYQHLQAHSCTTFWWLDTNEKMHYKYLCICWVLLYVLYNNVYIYIRSASVLCVGMAIHVFVTGITIFVCCESAY